MARRVRESRARFIHEPLQSKRKFDLRSFRTKVSRAHRITFGCPKGKYSSSTELCKVPVQIQKILHPMEEALLSNPCPISKNSKRRGKGTFLGEELRGVSFIRPKKGLLSLIHGRPLYAVKFGEGSEIVIQAGSRKEAVDIARSFSKIPIIRAIKIKDKTRRNPRKDITIEKEATKFFSQGVGIGTLVEHLKRKYDLSTDMARYFARRAGAVTWGARKYVAPSVKRAVYPMMLNPRKRKPLIERASYYKWYVGVLKSGFKGRVFYSLKKPSLVTHGHLYKFVTGPFESKIEAQKWVRFMGWDVVR